MRTIILFILAALMAGAERNDGRIDLAEFGQVVQYNEDASKTLQPIPLERGLDGWEAWKGPDGQYMVALEFDQPRDLAEVSIEFRHAIADRHLIKMQYFKQNWPDNQNGKPDAGNDPSEGEWVTAAMEWWAGDRDVNFAFLPYSQERPGPNAPDVRYRRTSRIRFLLGERDLPPVRYIHAYGPNPPAEGAFELQFEEQSAIYLPLEATVENGYLLEGGKRTPVLETTLYKTPAILRIRYAWGDTTTSTRTIITLRNVDGEKETSFSPAEAARQGSLRIASTGVTVVFRGGTVHSQPAGETQQRRPQTSRPSEP